MDIIMDQRNTGIKRYLIALLGIAAAVFIDQITKHLAVLYLKGNPARVIIDGVFELQYLENRGAAFGMMQNMQFVFVAGAVAICIVIFYLYIRMPDTVSPEDRDGVKSDTVRSQRELCFRYFRAKQIFRMRSVQYPRHSNPTDLHPRQVYVLPVCRS